MIDLEKLRELAQSANTAEQWYSAHDMTSCSYDYDKAFIAECSPSVVIELLDRIAQLEKDAGRYRKVTKLKNVWGVLGYAYGLPSEEAGCGNLDESLDAMEAKHG